MGKRGRFLGTATEARRIAKEFLEGKTPDYPLGRNRPIVHYEYEYAAVVRLAALYRMEQRLQDEKITPKDVVAILDAARAHETWITSRGKKRNKGGGKVDKDPERPPATPRPTNAPPEDEPSTRDFSKLDDRPRKQA